MQPQASPWQASIHSTLFSCHVKLEDKALCGRILGICTGRQQEAGDTLAAVPETPKIWFYKRFLCHFHVFVLVPSSRRRLNLNAFSGKPECTGCKCRQHFSCSTGICPAHHSCALSRHIQTIYLRSWRERKGGVVGSSFRENQRESSRSQKVAN